MDAAPTVAPDVPTSPTRESIARLLGRVRERTLLILATVSEDDASLQHDPLMSPIVWDLGHVSAFEKLWLQDQLERAVRFGEMPGIYDPFEHPRVERASLPLPTLRAALDELARVRDATLELLRDVSFDDDRSPAHLYHMVAQHESQHQETILQTLQLKRGAPYTPPLRRDPPSSPGADRFVGRMRHFAGGEVTIGTDDALHAYDNERPAHAVTLAPFDIDAAPVTNGEYAAFMAAGGYEDESLWSAAGRAWLRDSNARSPKYWHVAEGVWFDRTMDRDEPIDPIRPVCHVCFYEAEAYATWARKRLPTEYEWEAAAALSPLGNVDQLSFRTAQVGAFVDAVSALGCHGMLGDVWEWTSTDFRGYPGFAAFPYREYSEPFFGDEYKVLRGASWATAASVARVTFRNWDFPIRRQIFAGFRCARDA